MNDHHPVPIVLLEDDATLRALIAEGLKTVGYAVTEVSSGAATHQALSLVGGRALLVADRAISGGGPNGFQIAAEALEKYPALKVVYVTGTHIAIRHRALGQRERALLKPFAMTQLLAAVRDLTAGGAVNRGARHPA